MPTYIFRCPRCKYKFTGLFRMQDSDGTKVVCPECKGKGVNRVYEGSTFFVGKPKKTQVSACPSGICGLKNRL